MELLLITVFTIGYIAITLEHNLKIDKLVPALIMMSVLWAIIGYFHLPVFEINPELKTLGSTDIHSVLVHHIGKTAEILIFLIGAMSIVEIIDFFRAFENVKKIITSKKDSVLIWVFTGLAFFLSAIIDNLTATIVLITILQKIIDDKNKKFWYSGVIIIAANAGGAWSPIGDVTTTMLWIAGKVTPTSLFTYVFIPSALCAVIPIFIMSRFPVFRGTISSPQQEGKSDTKNLSMLIVGLGSIVFVPIFKTLTGLPPYIGMCLSLCIIILFAEYKTKRNFVFKEMIKEKGNPIHYAFSKLEMSSILFFLGILMAVAALESVGELFFFAEYLNNTIPNTNIIIFLLGIGSAVIDNVPLVAAGIGMFPQPSNDILWYLLAYSAGTGGSILIIGSAAGVIAMGMEKIGFFDYLKKISLLAFIGFLSGYLYMLFI